MKVSYNYLKKFIDFEINPNQLGDILTSTGLEVESIEKIEAIKGGLEGLVIGQVIDCQKHPDADKLSVTKVDVGQENYLDIVCGASNIKEGQKVIVATVGATLYPTVGESFVIKRSKIRGAVSEGMICAEDEIGLGTSHDGIIVLHTELPVGTAAIMHFNLEPDYVIEIGLTPNRADAASHFGVARDIKAVTHLELKLPDVSGFKLGKIPHRINLSVENLEACPRFCGLEIQGVEVKESPQWLKNFLNTIGINSINNIVDISNYVCHFLGQPMHIFDADEITGNKVIVKIPEKDDEIVTLDGVERKLSGYDLAVCNANKPMAIAGVFGGNRSGVKVETKNIFLEVAYFNPDFIRKTANFHSLKTDASFRYERGTDPNMPPFAIKLAALMVKELAGGEFCDLLIDNYPNPIPNFEILLKFKNINRLIGKTLDPELIISILNSLEIAVLEKSQEFLKVSVPPYRVDVTREADVIEEVLRIYGFDNVELSDHLNSDFISDFQEKGEENLRIKLSETLASVGFNEIQTLSIIKPSQNEWLNSSNDSGVIKLLNPLSEELSEMRQSLLFSGLNAIHYNINRRSRDIKVFEFGRTYSNVSSDSNIKVKENKVLSIWMTGNKNSESWDQKSTAISFQNLNQAVSLVLSQMKIQKPETIVTKNEMFAFGKEYMLRNKVLVSFGLINNKLLLKADIKQPVYYAEFDWSLLMKLYSVEVKFVEIPKYPEVRRDLSLVLEKSVKFEDIKRIAFATEKKLLKSLNVFDVYTGDKLKENQKSYSVSFVLQDQEKTLNEVQIEKTMDRFMLTFEKEIGAIIRK